MIQKQDPLLIIGVGSIGERHITNLRSLGYQNLWVLRSRNLPYRTISPDWVQAVDTWEKVAEINPKAAFICTPTSLHFAQTMTCLKMGMHVFVEKPISHLAHEKDQLLELIEEQKKLCFVGYMMRYHPLVAKMKGFVMDRPLGKLLSFTSHWGEYLPNWHPWEDYRESYAARKELGGGAALTLSHDLDLIFHLVQQPLKRHFYLPNRASSLQVTAEAGADFLLEFENGSTGHVHLNYYQNPADRYTELIFENGSLRFDYYKCSLTERRPDGEEVHVVPDFDRNQLFINELVDFFAKINTYNHTENLSQVAQAFQLVAMCQD